VTNVKQVSHKDAAAAAVEVVRDSVRANKSKKSDEAVELVILGSVFYGIAEADPKRRKEKARGFLSRVEALPFCCFGSG